LLEIRWFLGLQQKYPNRFFYFFENEFDKNVVYMLASFLGIQSESTWVDDVIRNYNIRHPYEYTQTMKDNYGMLVNRYFEFYPQVKKHLESFFS